MREDKKPTVMLVRNVSPEKYGGGETYQLMVAEELRLNGFIPVIVTSSQGLLDGAKEKKIKVIRAPYLKRQNFSGWRNLLLPIYFVWQWRLYIWYCDIINTYRPAVINIQSRDDWIAATNAAFSKGVKILWTDHIDFRTWVLTNVNIPIKNIIGKWILRCAKKVDKIIFISNYEKNFFERCIKSKLNNLITIRNGVLDRRGYYRRVEAKKGSFCYVGRLVDYKGINELIAAFHGVEDENARLNIYGDGDKINEYKKISKDDQRINFLGYTKEPLRAIEENEFFVLPSYYEGLSLSLVDAMMMGKKIIASNVDGNPEAVTDGVTGLLVPAKNIRKLTSAMNWMLKNPEESRKLASNARKFYENNFDFDKIFKEQMLQLYVKKEDQ